jgi:hypothetical protein
MIAHFEVSLLETLSEGVIEGTDNSNQMILYELCESPAPQKRLNPKNRPGI